MSETVIFKDGEFVEIELKVLEDGMMAMPDGSIVSSYVSTYNSVGGPKAVLLSWDEECDAYTPWNTWYAAKDANAAWIDAKMWAQAEDLPAIRGI